jgi:hypothetical protein
MRRSDPARTPPIRLGHLVVVAIAWLAAGCAQPARPAVEFDVSFPDSAHDGPITGRAFVMISRDSTPEPRLEAGSFVMSVPFFGEDVSALAAGANAVIDGGTPGYPLAGLRDLPPGDYYVQALINVYTEFHRSDGHTIWAHMDQWEGQQFNRSPGNVYSDVQRVHLDPARGFRVALVAGHVIPPIAMPPDTKWVNHIRIQSKLLSDFWGHPFYLGATVLLPAGYDEHADVKYPTVFEQGHFNLRPPYGFTTDSTPVAPAREARLVDLNRETGYEFYRSWTAPDFPRMIVVTFQHPTPYFDDSYAVNSANDGPYGDALLQELIPYLESHFHMIAKPYARLLTGGSTGGWESLALQVLHPKFFGGTWTLYPDPVDFRHDQLVDAYQDSNAFVVTADQPSGFMPVTTWQHPERFVMRDADGQPIRSMREMSRLEDVLGSHGRSGQQFEAWDAVYGPVGSDGYPEPLWDKRTGHINGDVATYYRDHGYDLRAYLAAHWDSIGPDLVGKIHIDVGDMDNFYLNLAVMDLEAFLDTVSTPAAHATFHYGRPEKGHGWQHTTTANMLREMAEYIRAHPPKGRTAGAPGR